DAWDRPAAGRFRRGCRLPAATDCFRRSSRRSAVGVPGSSGMLRHVVAVIMRVGIYCLGVAVVRVRMPGVVVVAATGMAGMIMPVMLMPMRLAIRQRAVPSPPPVDRDGGMVDAEAVAQRVLDRRL